jgi:O-antigen/teichoic acid export membrane protein
MLVAALVLTILGFAFLVAAVATGQIAWAWACIAVGALGLLLLVVDLIRGRDPRGRSDGDPSRTAEEADARADG